MEIAVRIGWLLLALVHVTPALVLFRPALIESLYGASPNGVVGILLTHRGAAFLALVVAAIWAMIDPDVRRMGAVILAISIVGFLWIYWRAGAPAGPLRTIAIADLCALLPLALVTWRAWQT